VVPGSSSGDGSAEYPATGHPNTLESTAERIWLDPDLVSKEKRINQILENQEHRIEAGQNDVLGPMDISPENAGLRRILKDFWPSHLLSLAKELLQVSDQPHGDVGELSTFNPVDGSNATVVTTRVQFLSREFAERYASWVRGFLGSRVRIQRYQPGIEHDTKDNILYYCPLSDLASASSSSSHPRERS
jgi:hypothetical protein